MQKIIKRLFDISAASILLLLFAPLLLICCVLILFVDGKPIFFIQQRPGLKGQIFKIFKFRTMTIGTENLQDDAARVTKIGNILRKTSMDELLQLINVIKGDLSLVGPRPLLVEYLPLYSKEQMRRHDVLPGITGWAQVNGRNKLTWKEKFELDVWYVDHWSFWLDIKILIKTALIVVKGSDVQSGEKITMPKFNGSN